ncbi:MAG: diadenylate cyclase CdaA [Lachnospiraceae bacterium]|nr:diadenylate cyclase CdaA [Lachnospiraceae bacterium]
MQALRELIQKYFSAGIPHVRIADVVEILILAFVIYQVISWIRRTNTWALLKGALVLGGMVLIANIFKMNTILWLVENIFSVGLIAVIVIFQPEIRRALEQMGTQGILGDLFGAQRAGSGFTPDVAEAIARAASEMGRARTGALIVIERKMGLAEYERTGIVVDAFLTSQLLVNIFEHNTPLHDGAVIVRGDRVSAATCYLPLSENRSISKDLGTRHRAAMGMSEVTDSVTVVVSEETGKISLACDRRFYRGLSADELKSELVRLCVPEPEEKRKFWKGWLSSEKKAGK